MVGDAKSRKCQKSSFNPLRHYGGWHSGATGDDGFLNHVCHSGDGETTKTWACATHKQFTMQAVAVAIAKVKMAGNTGPPHAMYLILRPC